MNVWLFLSGAIGILLGLIGGLVLARLLWLRPENLRDGSKERSGEDATQKVLALSTELASLQSEHRHLLTAKSDLTQALTKNSELSSRISAYEATQGVLEERLKAQKEYQEESRKQAKSEFENIANQILETKSKTFSEHTEKNLETILKPLKEKIATFEKKVEDSYSNEAKERFALKSEVERLITLNEKMTLETNNLTQALKGDSKFQGDWGEMVLANILEASGLREGHEYTVQEQLISDDGEKFRPDVVINLPDSKHVIVDSKVSLTAYELYCRTEDPTLRADALKSHLISINTHIDELADKHYSKLKGINSPDFVFMFLPIEPAYVLAVQNEREIFIRAWKKGVALVTSTILMTSLKTVASIWKVENQNKNSLEIANEASRLYDKFVGFIEDFEKVGRTFEQGQQQYQSAMGKLRDGSGNVFRKMELLRELGASPNKRIKQELLD
jgi:DNA recombination protein RmuC